jgi:hypothetical protein
VALLRFTGDLDGEVHHFVARVIDLRDVHREGAEPAQPLFLRPALLGGRDLPQQFHQQPIERQVFAAAAPTAAAVLRINRRRNGARRWLYESPRPGVDEARRLRRLGEGLARTLLLLRRHAQERSVIAGSPDQRHISTSIIERQNLTMRMSMRRFTRLTNGFSKKIENMQAAVALHFTHYNFVRMHKTLRMTPAMAASVENNLWSLRDLVERTSV